MKLCHNVYALILEQEERNGGRLIDMVSEFYKNGNLKRIVCRCEALGNRQATDILSRLEVESIKRTRGPHNRILLQYDITLTPKGILNYLEPDLMACLSQREQSLEEEFFSRNK